MGLSDMVRAVLKNSTLNIMQQTAGGGFFRLVLEVDGENIVNADPHIGFSHRGIEKLLEHKNYAQAVSLLNHKYSLVLAIEKLLKIKPSKRAAYIRVFLAELLRIMNHMQTIVSVAESTGNSTPSYYGAVVCERIMEFLEQAGGSRLHADCFCVGGVAADLSYGFMVCIVQWLKKDFLCFLDEIDELLTENQIFKQRTAGIGIVSSENAIEWSFSGANLRASGALWDLRKTQPYDVYGELDFEIPIGKHGDCYSRYLVRMAEMRQSASIIFQIIEKIPEDFMIMLGDTVAADNEKAASTHSYKNLNEVPAGQCYASTESPNGEFGVYLVSDGLNKPYRCKIRTPSFAHLQAVPNVLKGHKIEDINTIISSLGIEAGEADR